MTKKSEDSLPLPPPARRLGGEERGEGITLDGARELSANNKGAQLQNARIMKEARKIVREASVVDSKSPSSTPTGKYSKAQSRG